ncbi:MAG: Fic family protein [Candidatus Babeliales bacterium]|jgi:Fic family protein
MDKMTVNRSGKYVSQPTGYTSFVPNALPPTPPLTIDADLQKLLWDATLLLARLDGMAYTLPNTDLFITMYIKKEALLSAQIEGTQASLEDIFEFEQGEKLDNINDVVEVVNYIKALHYGIARLETLPMSLKLIKELHATLLQGVRGAEKTPGEFKRSQNWIGAPGCNLTTASYVPPTPEDSLKALGDLELYMHQESKLPELINCALIHYQFETIHPFLDGNGRLGRLLITFYLYWKGILKKPLLYLSYYLKKNRQEYYDRLTLVRTKGNYEQWIEFFLKGIIETCNDAIENIKKILQLRETHQTLLYEKKLSSPLAIMLLDKLFYTPLLDISDIQKAFNLSYPTASGLINQFEAIGILKEVTGKKRGRRFVYVHYLAILSEGTMLEPR